MQLIRRWDIPERNRHIRRGPCPDGFFMALNNFHDMPIAGRRVSYHDVEFLVRYGELYMSGPSGQWTRIHDVSDVPNFEIGFNGVILPFMPEFYYVPTSWRGHRHMRRARQRS